MINIFEDYDFREKELINRYSVSYGNKHYDINDVMSAIVDVFIAHQNIDINKKDNPNSIQNLKIYRDRLLELHWAWPYNMASKEMFDILSNVDKEKDFDEVMLKWFSKNKMEEMFYEIEVFIENKHKTILRQAYKAFLNHSYAIANNALISIIDNTLAKYLLNKCKTNRYGILEPIVSYYAGMPKYQTYSFLFDLMMVSNNVNFVFEDISFDNVSICTNKIVRRHPTMHGVKYSNKKIDTIMLFNLLFAILKIEHRLLMFKDGLVISNKRFVIDKSITNVKIESSIESFILSIIRLDKEVTHKKLVECLDKSYYVGYYPEKSGVIVSKILQKLKRRKEIESKIINGVIHWSVMPREKLSGIFG